MKVINKRLELISEYVTDGGVIADIGTDHCYLPIYLCHTGKIRKAYAADITPKTIRKAMQNIDKFNTHYNVQLNIIPLLSDGLTGVKNYTDITDIIIAGMGGDNIINIIRQSETFVRGKNLILQANSKVETLRKFLYEHGYIIKSESLIACDNFLYVIINCIYAGTKYTPDYTELLLGIYPNLKNSRYYDLYLDKQLNRLKKIKNQLAGKDNIITEFGSIRDINELISILEKRKAGGEK